MVVRPLDSAFTPFKLGALNLRNRFIKTATYEGMSHNGVPSDELIAFHRRIAEGGVAMTTVAYGAVNRDGLTNENQIVIDNDAVPFLERLAVTVHRAGAAVSMQLTHCGYFTRSTRYISRRPPAPTVVLNKYGLLRGRGLSRAMTSGEIGRTVDDFVRAAGIVKKAGFDAIEIHMGHGYLLSQFLSPAINKRTDDFGGSLTNRMRFPLLVLRSVKEELGNDFPVICKINMSDGFRNGLTPDESMEFAAALQASGANALVLSGGYTSRTPFYLMRGDIPLKEMVVAERNLLQKITMALFGSAIIRKYSFGENFFLDMASEFREKLKMPLIYVGGVTSSSGIVRVMDEGFDLIAIGRALIHDPDFIWRVKDNESHISDCNHCNVCVAEMDRGGVACPLDVRFKI